MFMHHVVFIKAFRHLPSLSALVIWFFIHFLKMKTNVLKISQSPWEMNSNTWPSTPFWHLKDLNLKIDSFDSQWLITVDFHGIGCQLLLYGSPLTHLLLKLLVSLILFRCWQVIFNFSSCEYQKFYPFSLRKVLWNLTHSLTFVLFFHIQAVYWFE